MMPTVVYFFLAPLVWGAPIRPSKRLKGLSTAGMQPRLRGSMRWAVIAVLLLIAVNYMRLSVLLVGLMIAVVIWRSYREARQKRQHVASTEALAELLSQLHSQIDAGVAPARALETAVESTARTMPTDMRRVMHSAYQRVHSAGGSPAATLAQSALPELVYLGKVWGLAEHHGLPLAPLMEHARGRLDAQLRHYKATAASLSGPKASALILSALPFAGMILGKGMGADPWGFLSGGGLGGLMLVIGVGLSTAGWLWCQRIISKAQDLHSPAAAKEPR